MTGSLGAMSSRVPPEQVRSNRGAAGIDGQTIAEVETYGVARMLDELRSRWRLTATG
jgi:2-succinyl-5-enolpyruvyl-6-hydroxy-3-cyclohexene-1-carboxylate synthase